MFRVVLAYYDVPKKEGAQAALDIAKEFNEHRSPRYQNAVCVFDGSNLVLSCDTDWDPNGLNLMKEFSHCVSAYIKTPFDGDLRLISSKAF